MFSPRVDYSRVVAEAEAAVVDVLRYVVVAPFSRAYSRSRGARAACGPLARTRVPPYLPPFLSPHSLARSTAHATRTQKLQPAARPSTHFRARNPNHSFFLLMYLTCAYETSCIGSKVGG